MPITRKGTPPSSQVKKASNVLGTLSAWTADDEEIEEEEDEEETGGKSKGAYRELAAQGESADQPETLSRKIAAWLDVEADGFNMIIGLVILFNATVIGLETDMGRENFTIFEHVFNSIFLIEMILRIRQHGCAYFKAMSNLFDCSLVFIGSLDLWILPLCEASFGTDVDKHNVGYKLSVMRALRVLRLLRVLRVIRLFRMFQQLYLIMQAFIKAFQVVVLISVLVMIIDYVCAIMLTQGIGQRAHLWGEDAKQIEEWFGSIGRSMQTLFIVMTLSDWDRIVMTLMKVLPAPLIITAFVLYIMVTSYTMISLITSIITDSLVTSQQEYKRRKLQKAGDAKRDLKIEMTTFLKEMHEDDFDEVEAVKAEDLKTSVRGDNELLGKLGASGVSVTEKGLLKLVDSMSRNGQERINTNYFVDKLVSLHGSASASSVADAKNEIVSAQYLMKKLDKRLECIAQKMFPGESVLEAQEEAEEVDNRPAPVLETPAVKKRSSLKQADPIDDGSGATKKRVSASKQMRFGGEQD